MQIYNTLQPYKIIEYDGIAYGHCRDFNHISRYKSLRQITHNSNSSDRFIALETPNPFTTNCEVDFYEVSATEENRLDIIAYKTLGSAQYAWVIAYCNKIEDGFTIKEGQKLAIPKTISEFFKNGEILSAISPLALNLGDE